MIPIQLEVNRGNLTQTDYNTSIQQFIIKRNAIHSNGTYWDGIERNYTSLESPMRIRKVCTWAVHGYMATRIEIVGKTII